MGVYGCVRSMGYVTSSWDMFMGWHYIDFPPIIIRKVDKRWLFFTKILTETGKWMDCGMVF